MHLTMMVTVGKETTGSGRNDLLINPLLAKMAGSASYNSGPRILL